jgi:hypothetical protein
MRRYVFTIVVMGCVPIDLLFAQDFGLGRLTFVFIAHQLLFDKGRSEVCYAIYLASFSIIEPGPTLSWLPHGHVELPLCPVCLERLDTQVAGLVAMPYGDETAGRWAWLTCPTCTTLAAHQITCQGCPPGILCEEIWVRERR